MLFSNYFTYYQVLWKIIDKSMNNILSKYILLFKINYYVSSSSGDNANCHRNVPELFLKILLNSVKIFQTKRCNISWWALKIKAICMWNNNNNKKGLKEQNNRLQQVSHWCYYCMWTWAQLHLKPNSLYGL